MRWAIRAAFLALCAAPAVSGAQETAVAAATQTAQSPVLAGAPDAPVSVAPDAPPPTSTFSVNAIVESEIKSFDPWEVGAATRAEGQLPNTLWKNSDAVAVGALFDKLTKPFDSPAANRLARAALLSPGSAPAGSDAASKEAVRKRFAALGRFGAAEEIGTMVSASPAALQDPSIAMFAAQGDLARGKTQDACRRAQAPSNANDFFLRLRAFCFAAGGDSAAADLALDVARTSGVNDPWLFSALPVVNAPDAKTKPAAKYDNSLDTVVSLTGGFKPALKPLAGSSPLAMGALARSSATAPAIRVEAAVATMRVNALDAASARAALESGAALKPTKAAPVPMQVGAVKTVAAATESGARAAALEAALNGMLNFGDYVALARMFQSDLAALPKDVTTAAAGTAMARANLALGDYKSAAEWRNVVMQSATPPPAAITSALDAALVAAGQGNSETAKVVVERRISLASGLSLRRAARDVVILQALGVPAPAPAAGFLNTNQPAPATAKADQAALAKAVESSQRGAQGETAIYVAQALAAGADKVELDAVVTAIQALRAVNLMEAARIVAVEAMISGGIA